jgi:hypothetical protein
LALFTFAALAALALAVNSLGGPVGTASGFEDDDGNLVDDTTTDPPIDWNDFDPTDWDIGDAPYRQTAQDPGAGGWKFAGIEDDEVSNDDTAFAGGTKQDNECATVKGAKAPNKDDLKRIYLSTKNVGGDTFLNLAWVRIPQNTTSPSAHIGFEFNRATADSDPCPDPPSDGLVHRTTGDMLIIYDFEGGSTDAPSLSLRRWYESASDTIPPANDPFPGCEVSSNDPPCWGEATSLPPLVAEGKVNTGSTLASTAPTLDALAPPTPPAVESVNQNLGTNEFGEAGINLTDAGVITPGECVSFGTVFAVSRSSGNSATAQMKDLVGPGPFEVQNCAPTTTTTEQFVYPNDKATISVGSGFGNLAGTVTFQLFDDATECANGTPVLFTQTITLSAGTTTQTVETTNYPGNTGGPGGTLIPPVRITDDTPHYWKVSYDSTNPLQTDSESACGVETTTVDFVQPD